MFVRLSWANKGYLLIYLHTYIICKKAYACESLIKSEDVRGRHRLATQLEYSCHLPGHS